MFDLTIEDIKKLSPPEWSLSKSPTSQEDMVYKGGQWRSIESNQIKKQTHRFLDYVKRYNYIYSFTSPRDQYIKPACKIGISYDMQSRFYCNYTTGHPQPSSIYFPAIIETENLEENLDMYAKQLYKKYDPTDAVMKTEWRHISNEKLKEEFRDIFKEIKKGRV